MGELFGSQKAKKGLLPDIPEVPDVDLDDPEVDARLDESGGGGGSTKAASANVHELRQAAPTRTTKTPKKPAKTQINVRLPNDLEARMRRYCKEERYSPSQIIEPLLDSFLKEKGY